MATQDDPLTKNDYGAIDHCLGPPGHQTERPRICGYHYSFASFTQMNTAEDLLFQQP